MRGEEGEGEEVMEGLEEVEEEAALDGEAEGERDTRALWDGEREAEAEGRAEADLPALPEAVELGVWGGVRSAEGEAAPDSVALPVEAAEAVGGADMQALEEGVAVGKEAVAPPLTLGAEEALTDTVGVPVERGVGEAMALPLSREVEVAEMEGQGEAVAGEEGDALKLRVGESVAVGMGVALLEGVMLGEAEGVGAEAVALPDSVAALVRLALGLLLASQALWLEEGLIEGLAPGLLDALVEGEMPLETERVAVPREEGEEASVVSALADCCTVVDTEALGVPVGCADALEEAEAQAEEEFSAERVAALERVRGAVRVGGSVPDSVEDTVGLGREELLESRLAELLPVGALEAVPPALLLALAVALKDVVGVRLPEPLTDMLCEALPEDVTLAEAEKLEEALVEREKEGEGVVAGEGEVDKETRALCEAEREREAEMEARGLRVATSERL